MAISKLKAKVENIDSAVKSIQKSLMNMRNETQYSNKADYYR